MSLSVLFVSKLLYKFAVWIKHIKHKGFPLCWWVVFVGYAIAFAAVGVCIYFIVLFGAALGENLATQWLISMVIGIVKSIFVIQPMKVHISTVI